MRNLKKEVLEYQVCTSDLRRQSIYVLSCGVTTFKINVAMLCPSPLCFKKNQHSQAKGLSADKDNSLHHVAQ
jgi:hypothetical protein